MSLRAFMEGPFELLIPPPGGALNHDPHHCDEADLYLAEVARLIKRKSADSAHACEILWMKIEQICNQRHFDEHHDALILERLGIWIRELAS